jgi:hypothetical protein
MGLPVIEMERLLIRDVRESDTEAFFGYMQHENYWYYVPIDRLEEILYVVRFGLPKDKDLRRSLACTTSSRT